MTTGTGKGIFVTAIALLLGWGGAFAQCDSTITKEVDPLTGQTSFHSTPISYTDTNAKYISHLSVGGTPEDLYFTLIVESEFDLVCLNQYNDKAFLMTNKKSYPLIHIGATNCQGTFLCKLNRKNLGRVQDLQVNGIRLRSNGRSYDFVLTQEQCKHLVCRLDAITENSGK